MARLTRPNAVALGCLLALVGGATALAAANSTAIATYFAPPAPVIVSIDLAKVFAGLEERMSRQSDLENAGREMQGQLDAMLQTGKDEEGKANVLPDGPEKNAAIEKLGEMQMNIRVKKEVFDGRLDQRRAETFRLLYNKIADASKRLAKQNKYTIVLNADDTAEVPRGMNTQDTMKFIASKRLVWADAGHDITAELVTFMNTEYRAAGGRPPAPAPAAVPVPGGSPAPAAPATPAGR